jgi:hypothetical protein
MINGGHAGTLSGQNSPALPVAKKSKKKSLSNAAATASSPSPGDKKEQRDFLFLPHTGIDLPFLKKKINFIKDSPEFEQVQLTQSNYRYLMAINGSAQH